MRSLPNRHGSAFFPVGHVELFVTPTALGHLEHAGIGSAADGDLASRVSRVAVNGGAADEAESLRDNGHDEQESR